MGKHTAQVEYTSRHLDSQESKLLRSKRYTSAQRTLYAHLQQDLYLKELLASCNAVSGDVHTLAFKMGLTN